jgi:hypothetical protein
MLVRYGRPQYCVGMMRGIALCSVMLFWPNVASAQASAAPPTATPSPQVSNVQSGSAVPASKKGGGTSPAAVASAEASTLPQIKSVSADGASGVPMPLLWFLTVIAVVAGTFWLLRWVFPKINAGRAGPVLGTLITLYLIGLFSMPFMGLDGSGWLVLVFVALAVSLAAAFFGFLFGLPQTVHQSTVGQAPANPTGTPLGGNGSTSAVVSTSQSSQDADGTLRPSTNLENVADSLTKYVTGAAFASLAATAAYVDGFGKFIGQAITGSAAPVLAGMTLIAYSALGFIISYIVTRIFLSESFRDADNRLLNKASEIFNAVLPDVGDDATVEQKALANQIIKLSFERLTRDSERLAWARAQDIVGDEPKARIAYASLYATNPNDVDVIIEFATALYDDAAFKDNDFILSLIDKAKSLVRDDDEERQARIAALKAATYLYVSGGYPKTILIVNDALKRGLSPSMTFRFHRACAFGQMYRAYKDNNKLGKDDDIEITTRITMDTAITFTLGAKYRALFPPVVNPDTNSTEDDLQAFAHDHPDYVKQFGFKQPDYPNPRSDGEPILVQPLPDAVSPPLTPAEMAKNAPP